MNLLRIALQSFFTAFVLLVAGTAQALPLKYEGLLPVDKPIIDQSVKVEGSLIEHLDDLIRKLMLTEHYESVAVDRQGDDYVIVAIPLKILSQIDIDGAKNFSESQILEQIGLKAGEQFDRDKAVKAGEKLKAFYGESGYYDAVIDVEFKGQPDGNMVVHFQIDEKNPCRISSFVFRTENSSLQKKLTDILKGFVGQPLSETLRLDLQKRINEYLSEARYLRAEIKAFEVIYNESKSKVALVYTISEPYQYDVVPVGINHISVIEFYQTLSLDTVERTGLDPIPFLADKMRDFYLSKGYANAQLKVESQDFPKNYLRRVKFVITEGEQTRLGNILVTGRISRAPSYYSNFIIDSSSDLMQFGFYNKQDLDNGAKNLITELKNQGFLKAKVISTRVEFDAAKREASIEVSIDEGPQTQVRDVEFEGAVQYSPLVLASVIPIKTNTPLRLNDVETSLEALRNFYFSKGHIEMKILNANEDLIQYNERGTQASIHFKIYEGPQVRVAKIVVEGNTFTHSDVVLREISIHVGDTLLPSQIDESTTRLNKFGIFSRVEIRTLEENTNVSERTLIVSVSERDPGVLRYGAGINSSRNFSVRGFGGLAYNNLGGTGRAISGRVELNYNIAQVHFLETKVAAGYLEPFLLNTRTRGRVNVSWTRFVFYYAQAYHDPTNPDPNEVSPFTVIDSSTKIDFLLERDLAKHIKLTWTLYGIDAQFTYERNGLAIDPTDGIHDSNLQVRYIGPTFDIDYRDNPFLPTRGNYFRSDTSYAAPFLGSSHGTHFLRTEANFTHYQRISGPRWVWTNSFRSGYEKNFIRSSGSGIPASYAFFLGGFNTIRGFDSTTDNERIPPAYDLPFVYPTQIVVPNDSYYYLIKSEVRFPIFGDFGGVLFYDGGLVQVTDYHFQHPYRQSVGFGLRLNTPVGPASLDIGFKIDPINAIYTIPTASNPLNQVVVKEAPFRVNFYIGTF
jgi:outer membrane protein assembly complex protein YaeT